MAMGRKKHPELIVWLHTYHTGKGIIQKIRTLAKPELTAR
jgi:hypothetical protein